MPGFLRRLLDLFLPGRGGLDMLLDEDLDWLVPPDTHDDPAAWDEYWQAQLSHGLGPAFSDMFCDDRRLVEVMQENDLRRVLCAGSGISLEPRALAAAGCEVTALDLSPIAMQAAETMDLPDETLARYMDASALREGGSVRFVAGNLFDESVCPGPYDVIIERRTVQTFPEAEQGRALEMLAERMDKVGIFFSHCHDGAWRPGQPHRIATMDWFGKQGWTYWDARSSGEVAERVAWFEITTG